MRLTGLQPSYAVPRFGQKLPKVANRFEIDLSEASTKHKPLILAAINKFNQSSIVKENVLEDVPDGIQFKFVSDDARGEQLGIFGMHPDGKTIAGWIIPDNVTQGDITEGVESVSQGLYMDYD